MRLKCLLLGWGCLAGSTGLYAQHSVARLWNEQLLEAIRNDYARPTVHARNLFHTSVAMYDAWAVYEHEASPYLLGQNLHGFQLPFSGVLTPDDKQAAQEEAISYAVYRLLTHRFKAAPEPNNIQGRFDSLMNVLGYDIAYTSLNYQGSPAGLGNYLAEAIINYGLQDGSNEQNGYASIAYEPSNDHMFPEERGNPSMSDPNHWQPLGFENFIDQSGHLIPNAVPAFLSPEWGSVLPFSLSADEVTAVERDGWQYIIYHDPGPPPYLDDVSSELSNQYKWNFELVAIWSAHLSSLDETRWDISPAAKGNIDIATLPREFRDYASFYKMQEGGDIGKGHELNPFTGKPYEPQYVKRGDYARVLAEFWADGPDSETPPGHWFTILNYVNDHPALVKKFGGTGEVLEPLEWDVKSYFVLGGAMHDAAISAWGIKGYYDYVRPISAIRYMAGKGQCTDPDLPNYHEHGIHLHEGYIELVEEGDPLAGANGEHIGKIKLYAWRGPAYIEDPDTDEAHAGWILAENWWPYQRPTFVTPPFAGYVSGHSTYSRAAAEVLTLVTGDPFFPGGMGEFPAPKNEFLVFEEGPSEDVILQWATYRDASDQCSLSRIWGGIHPPADDLNGRIIGEKVGKGAFSFALKYFNGPTVLGGEQDRIPAVYPNPVGDVLNIELTAAKVESVEVYTLSGVLWYQSDALTGKATVQVPFHNFPPGLAIVKLITDRGVSYKRVVKH